MDVFISYEHESKSIADNICSVLESRGIRCWYAPRDVYGDYATSIVNAIESCRAFVLILNDKASSSPHVLNEVEMAYQRILNGEITIVPFKVDEGTLSKAMEYYVKRLHWIDAASGNLETAILHLYDQLKPILGVVDKVDTDNAKKCDTNLNRKNVQYYDQADRVENLRLKYENEVLYEYEKGIYDKLLYGKSQLCALDFETLNPYATLKRLDRKEIDKLISFSYDESIVNTGNQLVKDNPNIKFYKLDINKDDVGEILTRCMQEMNIQQFDFVNLSMAIMDMKVPFKTLKKITKFLSPDAVGYVRDIDDGIVFAYPDEHEYFEKFKTFYKYDTLSGARNTARQVFNLMKKLGAKEVRLEKMGINTSAMDYYHKRLLFEAWFSFIPNDFKIMAKTDANNEIVNQALEWLNEYYDDLEEEYFNEGFLFNAGYIIYTVKF